MQDKQVLIIDDDPTIRGLYADALKASGILTATAHNGEEGVRLALTMKPDVILLDIFLPDFPGHLVAEKIRQDPWGKDACIIYLTNMSNAKDVSDAFKNNPEDYIIKANMDVKEVVNRVKMAMR